MPTLAKSDNRNPDAGFLISTSNSHPWWPSPGNNGTSSSGPQENGSVTLATLRQQNTADAIVKDKETNAALRSELNGNNNGHEQPARDANSQMELIGHSVMLTTHPYADPQYGGIFTYGTSVHPHFLGYHSARMPLPLEMEEEPVYVNAKQYHGILRRRQIRAKAELKRKLVKARKPYLHESRHKHAMRRARGSGGRFLNTKKVDGEIQDLASREPSKSGEITSSSSASAHISGKANMVPGNTHDLTLYHTQSTKRDPENIHFSDGNWNSLANRGPLGHPSGN